VSDKLDITPTAQLRWTRDEYDNSLAIAVFDERAQQLAIVSEVVIRHDDLGATHAWTEIYLPGAGWKGFDPTIGELASSKHIAVAIGRVADALPPIAGSFVGPPGDKMSVGVWVTELNTRP
jgi:transglutaminase-like putative cysteine protease